MNHPKLIPLAFILAAILFGLIAGEWLVAIVCLVLAYWTNGGREI